jgi:hypothetical protein
VNIIKGIRHNVQWPGQLNPSGTDPTWDELRAELSKLVVNGPPLEVLLETPEMVAKAQSICAYQTKKLGGDKKGWRFQTMSQGATMYVRRIAIPGK